MKAHHDVVVAAGRGTAETIVGMSATRRPTAATCAGDLPALARSQELREPRQALGLRGAALRLDEARNDEHPVLRSTGLRKETA